MASDRPDNSADYCGAADAAMIDEARLQAEAARRAAAAGDSATQAAARPAFCPDSFAGYQLLREIHRGGQGVVYQAIQKSTRRKVALKVMREGPLATAAEQARFEREIQVLGQLNHPNIVAIYDSGVAAGCQYFVMDYIGGQPLDVWTASGGRSVAESLHLFAKICVAVNAAHLRGITHRDLKPGNIRVDDEGEPHILDFGLAKVARGAEDGSLMTLTGEFVGSLPWASPEQAEGAPSKVDLRTDVYSLGVILYQMLTGRFPYEVIGNMRDVLERIISSDPVRPSTIRRQINDEVETIVLKCLQKERERRYQSAGELARDIQHYLAGEPIEAKRDSAAYVLRKYLRKYRLPTAVIGGFVVVVTLGLAASLTFWRQAVVGRAQAEQGRAAAEASEEKALAEAQRADRAAAAAKRQAAIAESVSKLIKDMLSRANRAEEGGDPNITVRQVMDTTAAGLEVGTVHYEPDVEAAVRTTIGQIYRNLGLYEQAELHLRRALAQREALFGHEHLGVAEDLESLGLTLVDKGQVHVAAARPLLEDAIAIRRRLLGDEDPAVAGGLHNLGTALLSNTDAESAEPLLREALAIRRKLYGDEHLEVIDTLCGLAGVAMFKGDLESAEGQLRDALERRRRLLGDEHPDVAGNLNDLAVILHQRGDLDGAEPLYRESLAIYQKLLGLEHPSVAMVENHLGVLLHMRGDLDGAEPLFRDSLAIRRKLAKEDSQLGYSARNLGVLLHDRGEYAEAEEVFQLAVEVFERWKFYGADVDVARIGLGSALAHQGRWAEGEPQLLHAEQELVGLADAPPRLYLRALNGLVYLYERWEAAEPGQGHAKQAEEWRARLTEWQAATQPTPSPEPAAVP